MREKYREVIPIGCGALDTGVDALPTPLCWLLSGGRGAGQTFGRRCPPAARRHAMAFVPSTAAAAVLRCPSPPPSLHSTCSSFAGSRAARRHGGAPPLWRWSSPAAAPPPSSTPPPSATGTAITAAAVSADMGVAGWTQKSFRLAPRPRGCHLITADVERAVPELAAYRVGVAHLFIKHTSAALTLNENCDPDVRKDMKMLLGEMVQDGHPRFQHRDEGDDDMAAHVVSSLVGASVSVPVTDGRLALGTWQGVWLVEWRHSGGGRTLTVTVQGEKK